VTDFANFPLEELVEYFDCGRPSFVAGTARALPAIFDDPIVGVKNTQAL
jgi:hypothetical protein